MYLDLFWADVCLQIQNILDTLVGNHFEKKKMDAEIQAANSFILTVKQEIKKLN
jgi:hypothetical protein